MQDTYLIYGENYSLIKREIDNIIGNNVDVIKYDLSVNKIDELLDDASCMSLFGDKKVIIGEDCIFLTASNTNVNHDINYLERYIAENQHDNIVILTVLNDKLDERKKIVKALKKNVTVIKKEKIDEKNLSSFIENEFKSKGYNIDYKTAKYFVDYVGKNVDILISEINKMIIYKDDDKTITMDDINDISSKGLNDNVFDLCDAVMKKDHKKIFSCYNDLMDLKEEPIRLISLIANQFILVYQSLLLKQDGRLNNDIANILGVHPYRVKLALETNYGKKELEDIIKKLHDLDYSIKSGKKDKTTALENFLLFL